MVAVLHLLGVAIHEVKKLLALDFGIHLLRDLSLKRSGRGERLKEIRLAVIILLVLFRLDEVAGRL